MTRRTEWQRVDGRVSRFVVAVKSVRGYSIEVRVLTGCESLYGVG